MHKYHFSKEVRQTLEGLPIPIAFYQFLDHRVVPLLLSQGFLDFFGIKEMAEGIDIMTNDMYRDTHPDDVARVADIAYRFAMKDGVYNAVYRTKNVDQDGYHLIHSTGKHMLMEDGSQITMVVYMDESSLANDVSAASQELNRYLKENVQLEGWIRRNQYDDLTGLPNMGYFIMLAEAGSKRLRQNGEEPVILFIDYNNLKYYNHTFGLASGNELLLGLATALRRIFGSEYTGRFDSDHFAVYTTKKDLEAKLGKLFCQVSSLNHGNSLSVRVGIVPLDQDKKVSTACDEARIAANSVKDRSKSGFAHFTKDLEEKTAMKEYILARFREALKEHWIKAYYQPIVDAKTGKVTDEEALARWIDPNYGMITPDNFIPVLEDEGLLYLLDLYMVDQAIEFLKKKQSLGIKQLPISINLSEKDFMAGPIIVEINKRLNQAGISKKLFTIEITERSIGRNPELLKEIMNELHANGYEVWLDDFGSDYSSLNIIGDYVFDLIKIDLKFLKSFDTNPRSRLILEGIIGFTKKFQISTVNEGVETEEEADFLRQCGTSKFQGYLYSRPLPGEELLAKYQQGVLEC